MRILLDTAPLKDPRAVAMLARGALNVVVAINIRLMTSNPSLFPPLYGSRVRFRPEPWAGQLEEFATALKVVHRGWGDCDDLCAYRVAELRVFGDRLAGTPPEDGRAGNQPAQLRIYGRGSKMHAQVRRGDARELKQCTIEDPSRLLGMVGPVRRLR